MMRTPCAYAVLKPSLRWLALFSGFILFWFTTPGVANAAPLDQITDGVTLDWHIGGTIRAITPATNTLYIASGPDLLILDITNPAAPTRLGSLTLGGTLKEIDLAGDYAYITAGEQGAYIVDISNPTAPHLVATVDDFSEVYSLTLFSDYAFLGYRKVETATDGTLLAHTGVAVLDVRNPAAFTVSNERIAGLSFTPYALEIADGQLFVAGGAFEAIGLSYKSWGLLQAFTLATPSAPAPLPPFQSNPGVDEFFYTFKIRNGIAYVVQGDALVMLSVATPTAITMVLNVPLSALTVSSLAVNDDQLYIAREYTAAAPGLYQFTIGTPFTLTQQGFYPHAVTATALQGDYAFVGSTDKGLEIWSLTNPAQPQQVGNYPNLPAISSGLTTKGSYLYLTHGGASASSLTTVDISAAPLLSVTSSTEITAHYAFNPLQTGTWLFVFDRTAAAWQADGIEVFDLTNPAIPQWRVRHSTPAFNRASLNGDELYLINTEPATQTVIYRFDVTDPLAPQQLDQITLPRTETLAVQGNTLYYVSNESPIGGQYYQRYLYLVDLTTPGAPQPISSFLLPWIPSHLVVAPNRLYVASRTNNERCYGVFGIVDLSQPTALRWIGEHCLPTFVNDLAANGSLVYLTLQYGLGLRVLDVTVPHAPAEVGAASGLGDYPWLSIDDKRIYLAGEGLAALRYQPPTVAKQVTTVDTLLVPTAGVSYTFPAGTFAEVVTVTHTTRGVDPWRAFAADQVGIGSAFTLAAVGGNHRAAVQPAQPFSVTVSYPDAAVGVVDENSLMLYRWTGSAWVAERGSQVDPVHNRVTASPSQLGLWMLAATTERHYLPLMQR